MVEVVDKVLAAASEWLWSYVLLFCLLGTHLYLTVILKFPQRHLLKAMGYYFGGGKHGKGSISHFPSLMVSLAANVGTGNIVGVATAVAMGGPGAVFWCMITDFWGYPRGTRRVCWPSVTVCVTAKDISAEDPCMRWSEE